MDYRSKVTPVGEQLGAMASGSGADGSALMNKLADVVFASFGRRSPGGDRLQLDPAGLSEKSGKRLIVSLIKEKK